MNKNTKHTMNKKNVVSSCPKKLSAEVVPKDARVVTLHSTSQETFTFRRTFAFIRPLRPPPCCAALTEANGSHGIAY